MTTAIIDQQAQRNEWKHYLFSTGTISKMQKAWRGRRIPINAVLRFQKFLFDTTARFIQDAMGTFQKKLNLDGKAVIKEISFH